MKFFLLILLFFSCGKKISNDDSAKNNLLISSEKNGVSCLNCLNLNIEGKTVNMIIEQDNLHHQCTKGSFFYSEQYDKDITIPVELNQELTYDLEILTNSNNSNCLDEIIDFKIKKNLNNLEIHINNDIYIYNN